MAKKNNWSGKNVTPRKAILMPVDWHVLGQKLAEDDGQPLTRYIMSLFAAKADARGIPRPNLPGEQAEN